MTITRLNGANGIKLSPQVDALFGLALASFDEYQRVSSAQGPLTRGLRPLVHPAASRCAAVPVNQRH